jgi:ATP-dependent DNA helicase RecG
MNKDSPGALVKKGESEILEFKEGFDKGAIETAVAFANTKGGTVLIGVADNGKVKG